MAMPIKELVWWAERAGELAAKTTSEMEAS